MFIPTNIVAMDRDDVTTYEGCEQLVIVDSNIDLGLVDLMSPNKGKFSREYLLRSRLDTPHGPSWKRRFTRNDGFFVIIGNIWDEFVNFSVDRVFSIKCPKWPNLAKGWVTRHRNYGWPSRDLIRNIENRGCHFVARPEFGTQWRYSFSLAERTLIHSWTPAQKYAYHILRLVKKNVTSKFNTNRKDTNEKDCETCEQVFCSYSLKTLMFWECETKPGGYWRQDNLLEIIEELILLFCEWVIDMKCLNFFLSFCNNWNRLLYCKCLETKLQYLIFIVGTDLIGKLVQKFPSAKESNFSMESLNLSSLHALFQVSGIMCLFNIESLSEILSMHKFCTISPGLKFLCRILTLQTNCSTKFAADSVSSTIENLEQLFALLCEPPLQTDEELELFPAAAMHLSIFEFSCAIFKYFASGDSSNYVNMHKIRQQMQTPSPVISLLTTALRFRCTPTAKSLENWFDKRRLGQEFVEAILRYTMPSAFHPVFEAYRINFYYVNKKDTSRVLRMCHMMIRLHFELKRDFFAVDEFNVVLTNQITPIYDGPIQSMIGFFTLLRSQAPGNDGSHSEVSLTVPWHVLIRYIRWRCLRDIRRKSQKKTDRLTFLYMLPVLSSKFSRQTRHQGKRVITRSNSMYIYSWLGYCFSSDSCTSMPRYGVFEIDMCTLHNMKRCNFGKGSSLC